MTNKESSHQLRVRLEAYLREPPSRSPSRIRRAVRYLLGEAGAERLQLVLTRLDAPRQRSRAAKFKGPGLRLHLGSGSTRLPGWVNVDLIGYHNDLHWDLKNPLPFADGSVEAIFSEHVLEHLPLSLGFTIVTDAHRLLRPGGIFRIGVPDARRYAESYLAGGRGLIEEARAGRPTPLIAMQEVYYRHGHCAMYDEETLRTFLVAAGFTDPERCEFGHSRIAPCPDSEARRTETLYVEAVKA